MYMLIKTDKWKFFYRVVFHFMIKESKQKDFYFALLES